MSILQYSFMQYALLAALLAGIACGIVGSYVVAKRIVFISGGISHAAFGGIGIGYFIGLNPILTAIPFSLLSAIGIGLISRRTKVYIDTTIGAFWAVGMAIGILFVALTPGYAPDLFSYLFGNILTVSPSDLKLMLILDIVIVLTTFLFYKEFLAICFDEEFAEVMGMPVEGLYLLLLCLVALSVVVLIRIVGIILVIALLTIPSAVVKRFAHSLKQLMFFSIISATILTIIGIWLSYLLNLPSGATIVLTMGIVFAISIFLKRFY